MSTITAASKVGNAERQVKKHKKQFKHGAMLMNYKQTL